MKKDNWIIYGVIAFTSLTTFGLISDGSVFGVFRGILASVILDGLVIYWEGKRTTCKNAEQRKNSEIMMWAGVFILLLFAAGFAIEFSLPSDVLKSISIFDYSVDVKLSELIVYIASTMIGLWVVLTLAMVLYLRGIDPETLKDIETTKAAQERENEELTAYRIANKHTAHELGTLKAMDRYRADLMALGKYTAGEVAAMVSSARVEVERQQHIPASMPADNQMAYAATVDAVEIAPKA